MLLSLESPSPMPARQSKSLLADAAAGSRAALDQLFKNYEPRLRRLLTLKSGSALRHAELDDLVQEAYLEALRQFASYTYQGPDSFFRWLATVAVHRTNNLRRAGLAEKRDARREQRLDASRSAARPPSIADPSPGPRTVTVAAEAQTELDAALHRLNPADREVIVLARVEGLPLPEIAERLGRSRNAVALLLSRALRKLKRELESYERDGE